MAARGPAAQIDGLGAGFRRMNASAARRWLERSEKSAAPQRRYGGRQSADACPT
jgi:hypothetical protein